MLQTKALKLLNKLNASEFKGFLRFLQSPVFNKNNRVIALYNLLKKYYPAFDSPKLEREKLYAKLYPNKKYSYQQFANLNSELTRLVEEYYSHLAFKADTFQQRKLLIQSYRDRDLYELFEKETENLVTETIEEEEPDFIQGYKLLKSKYFHSYNNKLQVDPNDLQQLMSYLDNYYMEEKMILSSEIRNRAAFLNFEVAIPLLAPILAEIAKDKDNHRLYSYLLLHKMLDTERPEDYGHLKEYFFKNYNKIFGDLRLIIFVSLKNYCSRKATKGNKDYINELSNLHQFGLSRNLILINNKITSQTFLGIVLAGVQTIRKNKNWLLEFIEAYQLYLDPSIKNEVITVSYAAIDYQEQAYEEVISRLSNFKSNDIARNFTAKKLLIRAYFEKFLADNTYYDVLIYACLSFEKVLQRNTVKGRKRIQANLNFSYLIKKIAKKILDNTFNESVKKVFLEEATKQNFLVLRPWFIDRLNHL